MRSLGNPAPILVLDWGRGFPRKPHVQKQAHSYHLPSVLHQVDANHPEEGSEAQLAGKGEQGEGARLAHRAQCREVSTTRP